ncbi:hypothetical protein FRC20_002802 [Serendipita sp. 405]|nr:hypothetical protein FRC15_002902 [Serendipita sp. 397]KAG8847208.1 hypothetical protein FRC20_002802 [Serendipita sp. 405]
MCLKHQKIPTLIAYQERQAQFYGAEAREVLDDPEYHVAKWFKLHLHPESMKLSDLPPTYDSNNNMPPPIEIPPLPEGVHLLKVYSGFLQYMYGTTRNFFCENSPNGTKIWDRLENKIIVVLCTPNGWDIEQQTFLRNAALKAGIVDSLSEAEVRIEFITEGEASVHYALAHTKTDTWLNPGAMFAVTDAGGSTVDSTLYECKSVNPLVLEEVCESECVQAGGVFIDRALQGILEDKLRESEFGDPDSVTEMVRSFERKTKRIFDDTQTLCILDFGGSRDNDRRHNILKGKITLTNAEVGMSFDDVVARIVDSVLKLMRGRPVRHILLVGGFGESPFLRKRLSEAFSREGTEIVTIEEPSKKAAAEGAAIWFSKQLVKARAARYTFGINSGVPFNEEKHREHQGRSYMDAAGIKRLSVFDALIPKGSVLTDEWEKVTSHHRSYNTFPTELGSFASTIYAWSGQGDTQWLTDLRDELLPGMRIFCKLKADFSPLRQSITVQIGNNGETFWRVNYQIVLSFKRSMLQARLRWFENGVRREGPVSILATSGS